MQTSQSPSLWRAVVWQLGLVISFNRITLHGAQFVAAWVPAFGQVNRLTMYRVCQKFPANFDAHCNFDKGGSIFMIFFTVNSERICGGRCN